MLGGIIMAAYKTYGDFPTFKEIKRDYKELMKIIKNVRTIEQVKKLDKENLFTIEINGMSVNDFLKPDEKGYICCDNDIEWIRYENYGCLSYIYDRFNGNLVFDIWSNCCDCEFIENITMDKLTRKAYEEMKAEALKSL